MERSKTKQVQENELEDLQKAGVEAYRNKDYKAALEHFTAALSRPGSWAIRGLSSPKRYELLNLRAAVYEKMDGKLEEAAKDARKMIRLDEKSVSGYLRAGKVLGLMGKWESALGMYRYGLGGFLRKIRRGRYAYVAAILVKMYEKVEGKVEKMKSDAKRTDPLIILPLELIDLVMLKMDFRSMVRCQRVCKTWRDFFRKYYYHTYRKLDFSHAVTAPKEKTFDKYINLSRLSGRAPIEEITFSRFFTKSSDALVKKCISECTSLHTLRIPRGVPDASVGASCFSGAESLQTIILECKVRFEDMVKILQTCKHLQRLECHKVAAGGPSSSTPWWHEIECPNLEAIDLRWGEGEDMARMEHIYTTSVVPSDVPRAMPNLRSIATLDWGPTRFFYHWNFTGFQHLEQFRNQSGFDVHFPHLPPSITILSLRGNQLVSRGIIDAFPLPNLHTLSLYENKYVSNCCISTFLSHLSSPSPLRILNLSQCAGIDATELSWLLAEGHCDYLEELYLVGVTSFGDQVTREMGCLGWLKGIDISQTGSRERD
ncbi:hypothetical protein BGX38DRAFT_643022 [Terfezia claveryi]|nr:hypothetical protein BGX38DRAFT_643022 [Terfezia claveryi]